MLEVSSGRDSSYYQAVLGRAVSLVVFTAAALVAGCGGSNHLQRFPVHGVVTLDGRPLTAGTIRFQPQEATIHIESGSAISEGKYQIANEKGLVPGRYQVHISALRETGRTTSTMGIPTPVLAESLPARYNTASQLSIDLQPDTDTFDFALESAK
jgi:hypothetical protein